MIRKSGAEITAEMIGGGFCSDEPSPGRIPRRSTADRLRIRQRKAVPKSQSRRQNYDPQKPEYVSGATKGMSMLEIGFGSLCLLGAVIYGIKVLRKR